MVRLGARTSLTLLIARRTFSRAERRLSEGEARWFFQQIVVGLDYCHSRGVANRDLKLENLLLDSLDSPQPVLKMCDFGYSKVRARGGGTRAVTWERGLRRFIEKT